MWGGLSREEGLVPKNTAAPRLATGESFIKGPSPLSVLKDAYDHNCFLARLD